MGMKEMPKLKPNTTHAHKKFHQTGAVQSRGLREPKKITNKSIYVCKYDRLTNKIV
jgi:hypothetical protein